MSTQFPLEPLGKVVRDGGFLSDGDWIESKDQDENGDVRLIQLADIGDGRYVNKSKRFLTSATAERLRCTQLKVGDILIARMPDPIGRACIFPGDSKEAITVVDVCLLRVDPGKVCADWLKSAINSDFVRKEIERAAGGTTRTRISRGSLEVLVIPTPPLPEQQKIAAILTTVDDKLDVITRQIGATQTLKQGLMQTLFTRGAGTPDAEGRWHPHTAFQDTELGRIPVGWSVAQLQELGTVIRGASPRPQGDPRYYGGNVPRLMGADVTRDGKWVTPRIDFLTETGAKLSRPCPKGTLTVICSGDVGIPAFLAVDACIHDGFLALINIDDKSVNKDYLYHVIFSLKQRLDSSATHGGVFTNLTTSIFKEFQIPLPPLVEQRRIAEALDAIDEKFGVSNTKQTHYQSLKRGLMQKLLTGEWRVKVDASLVNS